MNDRRPERHVVAEIDFGRQRDAIVWVGQRPLHHFWPLLSPYFRDVLLTPQRRSEEDSVAWHWEERSEASPPRAAELAGLRKRLAADQQAFVDSLARDADTASSFRAHGNVDQLGSAMETTIARTIALPDAALARFVCRTDAGLRLHSWSATAAASPRCPDDKPTEEPGRAVNETIAMTNPPSTSARTRWRIAALLLLLIMLGGGGWAWTRRSQASAEMRRPSRGAGSTSNSDPHAVASSGATAKQSATADSRDNAAEPNRQPRVARNVGAASTSESAALPLGQSDLARELIMPANRAALPASATAATASVGPIAATSPTSAAQASSSTASSPGNGAAQNESAVNDTTVNALAPNPTADPDQPPKRGTPAKLRRAIAASAEPDGTHEKNAFTTAAVPAEDTASDSEPAARSDRDSASNPGSDESPATPNAAPSGFAGDSGAAELKSRSTDTPDRATAARRASPRPAQTSSPEDEPAPGKPSARIAGSDRTDSVVATAWQQTIRLRMSPWHERLLDDAILPTIPRPSGANHDLGALRGELLRAKAAVVPVSFRRPTLHSVILFESSSFGEFTSTDLDQLTESTVTLRTTTGEVFAEMIRDSDDGLTLRVGTDISARLRITLEHAREDAPMRDGSARFEWQSRDRAATTRFEIPLTSRTALEPIQFATVRDRLTGWALVREIRLQTETTAR